jgi:hypothetical protein
MNTLPRTAQSPPSDAESQIYGPVARHDDCKVLRCTPHDHLVGLVASGGGAPGDEVLAFRISGGYASELTVPAGDVFH